MRTIDFFDRIAEREPDAIALVDGDNSITYRQLQTLSENFARSLLGSGIKRQEKVGIFGPNHWTVVVALLGCWRAGCIWIPINVRNAHSANADYLKYVECDYLFYHSSVETEAVALEQAASTIRGSILLDTKTGDIWSEGESQKVSQEKISGDCFGDLNEIAAIMPTGGTTGASKGVVISNLTWGLMIATAIECWKTNEDNPVSLVTAPITHAAGPVLLAMLGLGAKNILRPAFNADGVLDDIKAESVTHVYLPPTALYAVLDAMEDRQHDLSSLEMLLLVGSPVAPEKIKLAVEKIGPCICQCYGQVEAPMLITWLDQKTVANAASGINIQRLASCGKPTGFVRVGIVNHDGKLLPFNQSGEIVVRSPLVSSGYYNKQDATDEAHRNGWHHTGDVGYLDEDGYLYIVDRAKDMIITGGFNVFPAEIESAVLERTEILEAAVIGVPDQKWGEAVTLVYALNAGHDISLEELRGFCRERLGGVKSPKHFHVVKSLPKTPAGKIDKRAIREPFWQGKNRLVN